MILTEVTEFYSSLYEYIRTVVKEWTKMPCVSGKGYPEAIRWLNKNLSANSACLLVSYWPGKPKSPLTNNTAVTTTVTGMPELDGTNLLLKTLHFGYRTWNQAGTGQEVFCLCWLAFVALEGTIQAVEKSCQKFCSVVDTTMEVSGKMCHLVQQWHGWLWIQHRDHHIHTPHAVPSSRVTDIHHGT